MALNAGDDGGSKPVDFGSAVREKMAAAVAGSEPTEETTEEVPQETTEETTTEPPEEVPPGESTSTPGTPKPPVVTIESLQKEYADYKAGEQARIDQSTVAQLQRIAAYAEANGQKALADYIYGRKTESPAPQPGTPAKPGEAPKVEDLVKKIEGFENQFKARQAQEVRQQYFSSVESTLEAHPDAKMFDDSAPFGAQLQNEVLSRLATAGYRVDIKSVIDSVAGEAKKQIEAIKSQYVQGKKAAITKVAPGAGAGGSGSPAGTAPKKLTLDGKGSTANALAARMRAAKEA